MLTRRSLFPLSIAALAVTTGQAKAKRGSSAIAQLWAGLEFIDADERTFGLSEIRQPLKLVQFWANWCPACLGEMPSLASLARSLGEERAQVLLVSNPDDWRRDQLVAQRARLPFRLATLSSRNTSVEIRAALLDTKGAYVVPRSFLFLGSENVLAIQRTGAANWAGEAGRLKAWVDSISG